MLEKELIIGDIQANLAIKEWLERKHEDINYKFSVFFTGLSTRLMVRG